MDIEYYLEHLDTTDSYTPFDGAYYVGKGKGDNGHDWVINDFETLVYFWRLNWAVFVEKGELHDI